jgi:hypothetical protein
MCKEVVIQTAIWEYIGRAWRKSPRILSRELNTEPPVYKVGSLSDRPHSSTRGCRIMLFEAQDPEVSLPFLYCPCGRDIALVCRALCSLFFCSAATCVLSQGWANVCHKEHLFISKLQYLPVREYCSIFINHNLTHFMSEILARSQWKLASLCSLFMYVCPSAFRV